jgi:hypothetical protein
MGITDAANPRISDLAITVLAVIWLQKQPGEAEGDLVAKGQSGNATGPNRRFREPGRMGCGAGALPNSVRLIHNRDTWSDIRPLGGERVLVNIARRKSDLG